MEINKNSNTGAISSGKATPGSDRLSSRENAAANPSSDKSSSIQSSPGQSSPVQASQNRPAEKGQTSKSQPSDKTPTQTSDNKPLQHAANKNALASPVPSQGQNKTSASQAQDTLRALLDVLKTKQTTILQAKVDSLVQVPAKQLQLLLIEKQQIQATPTALKQAIQTLSTLPQAFLAKLSIKGSLVSVLTQLPLAKGQTVNVQVRADGQLQLLSPTIVGQNKNSATKPVTHSTQIKSPESALPRPNPAPDANTRIAESKPTQATNHNVGNQLLQKLVPGFNTAKKTLATKTFTTTKQGASPTGSPAGIATKVSAGSEQNQAIPKQLSLTHIKPIGIPELKNNPLLFKQAKAVLNDGIRFTLPQTKNVSQLTPVIQSLVETPSLKSESITLISKLAPLLTLLTTKSVPSNIQQTIAFIKQNLNQSGLFFENKIVTSLPAESRKDGDLQLSQDLKAVLIHISQQLSLSSPVTLTPRQQSSLDQALLALFGKSMTPGVQTQHKTTTDALNIKRSLQQLVQGALAKVQLNQYRTLNSLLGTSIDSPATPPILHMDIPVRWGEYLGNIFFQFQNLSDLEEKKDKKNKQKKTTNRWRVYMELELDDSDTLAVEVTSQDDQVGAKFWANNEPLRDKTKHALSQLKHDLEQQGLTVIDLRCEDTPPPQQEIKLDYALIDVKT